MAITIKRIAHNFSTNTQQINYREAFKDALTDLGIDFNAYVDEINIEKPLVLKFNYQKISEYPDQNEIKNFIYQEYVNSDGDLYWAGDKYESVEELMEALEDQKYIAELIVENKE